MQSRSTAPQTKIRTTSAYFDPGAGDIGRRPVVFVLVGDRTVVGLPVFLAAAGRAAVDLPGYRQPHRRIGWVPRT